MYLGTRVNSEVDNGTTSKHRFKCYVNSFFFRRFQILFFMFIHYYFHHITSLNYESRLFRLLKLSGSRDPSTRCLGQTFLSVYNVDHQSAMNFYLIKIPLNSYIIISVKRDKRFDILHTTFLIMDLSRLDVALQRNEDLLRISRRVMNAAGVEDLIKYQFCDL